MFKSPSFPAGVFLLTLWTAQVSALEPADPERANLQAVDAKATPEAAAEAVADTAFEPASDAAIGESGQRPAVARLASRIESSPAPHLVVVRISKDLLRPIIDKQLDRQTPVNDMILGTHVVGVARTRGTPTLALEEDPNQAVFQIVLNGSTTSRTTGRNGSAIIYSRSTTRFRVTKQVVFVAGKGFSGRPAKIQSNTRSVTDGIDSTRRGILGRLVKRRAWRGVDESRAEVNRIVQRNAERRLLAAFDTRLEEAVARLNRAVDLRQAIAYLRDDSWEPRYTCCSTRDYLQIALSKERGETAPIALPRLHAPAAPVQVWFHKSLVGANIAEALTRFQENRTGVKDFVSKTLQVFPTAIGPDLSTSIVESSEGKRPGLSYTTADDWIVVQIGPTVRTASRPQSGSVE